jgi:proteasome lid subunit RPN8/RPN11
MRITRSAAQQIEIHIGNHRAERGAMLGEDSEGTICRVEVDHGARRNTVEYSPDTARLNQVIKAWKAEGIGFAGFVHSHPAGFRHPSSADVEYSERILEHFDGLDALWLPIVQTVPDTGRFEILPFASVRLQQERPQARLEAAKLAIVGGASTRISVAPELRASRISMIADEAPHEDRFARMRNSFDLDRHAQTRLVFIGTGGDASLITNCARMGFGEFVLIDPQKLEAANVATQQANPARLGTPKVEALAEQIHLIYPEAHVQPLVCRIEEIPDNEFKDLLFSSQTGAITKPERTVLLVLTDNFFAQARGHRLGLQFAVPTICAQEYAEGRGAEVSYTVPGVTPACHRCITSSRYRQYLENNFQNDVTSAGAPVFAAEFLNAILGHVLLAVVYHGAEGHRFGGWIEQWGNRNLIQLRMDPEFEFSRGLSRLPSGRARVMFDSVFLAQTPDSGQNIDRPPCPDCGGTGDLRTVRGTFPDTRIIRILASTESELDTLA